MGKPHLKNSKLNLKDTLEVGKTYATSAWIQTADGPNMSDADHSNASYIQGKLLEFGLRISIQFQEKVGESYEKRGSMMLFTEDPNKTSGSSSKPTISNYNLDDL